MIAHNHPYNNDHLLAYYLGRSWARLSQTRFYIKRNTVNYTVINFNFKKGMWGYANKRNRALGNNLFQEISNSISFNPRVENQKGLDQSYL